ncbi:MAG: carboxypeptidase regulatory-like domain-containing protein [Planctomycetota bacterium]|nr:carboxypeptidase regulatory-like domain-containing protein [Planctomycetota bacterium]
MPSSSPRRGAAPRAILVLLAAVPILVLALWFLLSRADTATGLGPKAASEAVAPSAGIALEVAPPVELADSASAANPVRSQGLAAGVRLRGPGKLDGAVLERSTSRGVAGARIELLSMPPAGAAFLGRIFRLFAGSSDLSRNVRPVAVAISGPDGRFHFEGVRTGTYFLDARGDYHVPESVPRARVLPSGSGGPVELWVNGGGRVVGRALLPDGTPAKGATLALVPGPNNFLSTLNTGDMRWLDAQSDEQGMFAIPGVPPGEGYEITATGSGFAVSHLVDIAIAAGKDTSVVVQTRAGGSITGRVLAARADGDPTPLPEAHLGAVPRGLRNLRCAEEVLTATHCVSGADGTFVMRNVPPGDVDIVAIERTHLPAIGARASLADGVTIQADDIVLKPGAMIAGRVVDARGAPVAGVALRFNLVDWKNFQFDFSLAPMMAAAVKGFDLPKTDADGRFLAGPIAGDAPYEVTFSKTGYVDAELKHDPKTASGEVVVKMQKGGAVEGVVMDEARGEPVGAFTVGGGDLVEVEADSPGVGNPFSGGTTVEDATGRFRIESVRPGKSTLVFRAPGYLASSVEVDVVEGETKKGVIVQLSPGGIVRGVVLDAKGKPVAGAQVVAQASGAGEKARERRRDRMQRGGFGRGGNRGGGPPESPFGPMMAGGADAVDDIPPGFLSMAAGMGMLGDRAGTTNASGAFELVGVEPGSIRVHAFHRQYAGGSSEAKTMPEEGVLDGVVVKLKPGGAIVGTVTDRFGRPVADQIVLAFAPAAFGGPGGGGSAASGAYQGSTDDEGRYAIRHVGAGSYFLVATRGDEDLNPATFFGTLNFDLVTVPEGEEVEFDLVDSTAAACKVRGVVTYRGEPAARGNLVATSTDTESVLGVEFRAAKMLGGGRFEFAGLAPGTWQLQFDGDGPQVRTSIEVPDLPEVEVVVALPEGGVEGRVVDDRTNEPIEGVQVTLRRTGGAPKAKGLLGSVIARDGGAVRRNTDAKGEFRFDRLEGAEYEIVAQTPSWRRKEGRESYAPSEPALLRVDSTRVERDVVLRLLPSLGISGRVTGADAPIEGVRVVAIREGGGADGVESARTDAEGKFSIRGLASGKYRLSANADGWAEGRKSDIDVQRGREVGDVQMVLTKGVLVRARVSKGGLPVSGARVQLLAPSGEATGSDDPGRAIEGFFRGEGATDTQGLVEVGRYAPGKYRLEAQRGANRSAKDVTIDGRDTETELRIDLDG